jgi:hypothetical protein
MSVARREEEGRVGGSRPRIASVEPVDTIE